MTYWLTGHARRPLLAMHAFFDESEGGGFVCMTGFISDEARWNTFTSDWVALLDKHGLRLVGLHTKDFMSANAPYTAFRNRSWSERAAILREFIQVVRKSVLFGISIGVDTKAFRDVTKPYRAKARKIDDPYDFCFVRILKHLVLSASKRGINEHIALVVDDNEAKSMAYYQHYRQVGQKDKELRNRICSIAFGDDRVILPLQAADMLAWITSQEMRKASPDWINSAFSSILVDENDELAIQYETEYWDEEECRGRLASTYLKVFSDPPASHSSEPHS